MNSEIQYEQREMLDVGMCASLSNPVRYYGEEHIKAFKEGVHSVKCEKFLHITGIRDRRTEISGKGTVKRTDEGFDVL